MPQNVPAPTVTRIVSAIPRLNRGDELTPEYLTDEARELFEAQWRGDSDASGFSESDFRHSLAEHERDLALVRAGRISPRRIVGPHVVSQKRGDLKAEAVRFLEAWVRELREDIETRGQSNVINRSNVRSRLIRV
ncbi:hypothetical protein ACFCZ3_20190 [Cellulosimicrobium cellulans]|uniref:hypothetical protein n=1 Tax=Cellulosimicrobium cellulans TaxID=1710 RepID=UPI0035E0CB7B